MNLFSDFGRPVLSDKTIMKYNKKGILIEQPITKEQLQPNSVDLTLGNTWKTLKHNTIVGSREVIDPRNQIKYKQGCFHTTDEGDECFVIKPKQFVLMASQEILNIPNGILTFVQGRSSIARLAIQTEQAGLIDAGFRGTITFEVFNQSNYPIILYKGMRIAQVYFFKAQHADQVYGALHKGSKYSNQIEATGSRIYMDKEFNK